MTNPIEEQRGWIICNAGKTANIDMGSNGRLFTQISLGNKCIYFNGYIKKFLGKKNTSKCEEATASDRSVVVAGALLPGKAEKGRVAVVDVTPSPPAIAPFAAFLFVVDAPNANDAAWPANGPRAVGAGRGRAGGMAAAIE
jgi:hypothetical protein